MKEVCTLDKKYLNFAKSYIIIRLRKQFVKKKAAGNSLPLYVVPQLLFAEGHTVGALILGGVALVGAHHNAVQGAVILLFAVMGALVHRTFDGLIGMTVHKIASFLLNSEVVCFRK